jgi:hypothetical protein
MHRIIAATALGLLVSSPLAAQTPDISKMLQGLTTGNQNQDQALRDAFERGYQRGRQDEARMRRPSGGSDRSYSRSRGDNGGDGYGSNYGSDRSRSGDYER